MARFVFAFAGKFIESCMPVFFNNKKKKATSFIVDKNGVDKYGVDKYGVDKNGGNKKGILGIAGLFAFGFPVFAFSSGAYAVCPSGTPVSLSSSGISCTNSRTLITVNSNGTININNGTTGISVVKTGTSGNSGVQTTNQVFTATSDNGTPNDDTDDFEYLVGSAGSTTPILDDQGRLIHVIVDGNGDQILADSNGDALPLSELDNYIASGVDGGTSGLAAGDVTIINSASMNTTNANGISGIARGGDGGDGGVGSILFYSWGYDGGDGKSGGSVAITNDGAITTTGSNRYGVYASSEGGDGGNGGGFFGLFASDPGGGGDGGTGGTVQVDLLANSNIVTNGAGSHGVLAQSLGGDGGAGGSSSGLVALGNDGGDGGDGGTVTVNNAGSITTNGQGAYGIFARSYGAGAGSGTGAGGLVALGGNGGGEADGRNVTVTNSGDIETFGFGSHGVLAHSVGGGGGDGGNAGGLFTVGGKAGSGGNGGTVTYNQNGGSVITHQDKANAVYVQSIGGGGGNGGNAASIGVGVTVAVGGSAGPGGDGGNVVVNVQDTSSLIQTFGNESSGIIAQSIGGGGGNGGYGVSANISTGASVSVGVGGSGGSGGIGNVVNVTNYAGVTTGGDQSFGIIAQSIGGGGGNGGLAVAGSISAGGSVAVGIGGSGGSGGRASEVTINNYGAITTGGNGSHAIFGQSIGGGGGSGGASVAASISGGIGVNIGIAGGGAGGGGSRKVTITNEGAVITTGNTSHGILGQSVGGGGGSGGLNVAAGISSGANVNVGLGGSAGGGGAGNRVSIDNSGTIITSGSSSHGAVAQSIGGGGGDGGFNFSGGFSTSGSLSVGLGGSGGSGGAGNRVNLVNSGGIMTSGANSYGLLAQSVGGGGGTGGGNVSFSGAGGIVGGSIAVGLGGTGGNGNNAGQVFLTNSGNIYTTSDGSHAVVAQSIGGGGGAGGWSVGAAGAIGAKGSVAIGVSLGGTGGSGSTASLVQVTNTSTSLYTDGNDAYGILAQSIGGGGGIGGWSGAGALSFSGANGSGAVSVSLGGQGGGGGTGGNVTVSNSAVIGTLGDRSHGLAAQSLGGGGGAGGTSISIAAAGSSSVGLSAGVSLGGTGGGGGTAGNVTVTNNGQITTEGDDAYGILAQSIGGSGGSGGFSGAGSFAFSTNSGAGGAAVTLGGAGGSGSTAGTVGVTQTGNIFTKGDRAHGLVAQSLGGSGGAGGGSIAVSGTGSSGVAFAAGVSLGGAGGSGGTAKAVTVNSDGQLSTEGNDAYGLLAQSIGGSGGSGGFSGSGAFGFSSQSGAGVVSVSLGGSGGSGSSAGTVGVTHNGNIYTTGERAHGLVAQSIGGSGGSGGTSVSVSGAIVSSDSLNVGVSLGGTGGDGGTGRAVTVDLTGSVDTQGADAYGILAQSVGGSGGTGGFSLSGSFATSSGSGNGNVNVSLGGAGGDGGVGGAVTVTHTGDIATDGDRAHGLVAQSIGGNGGAAGGSIALSGNKGSLGLNVGVSLGGSGGNGGQSGVVTVLNDGNINTVGEDAHGILAQSIGGSGGSGGFSVAGAIGIPPSGELFNISGSVVVSLGGAGGDGGVSQDVAVGGTIDGSGNFVANPITGSGWNNGTLPAIITEGDRSHGIAAQSVGGSGGSGGFSGAVSGVFSSLSSSSSTSSASIAVTLGGAGGTGSRSGRVFVANDADIRAYGDHSYGILGQSIGGSGGTGGGSIGGAFGGSSSINASVSIGGFGGAGSRADIVSITNTGTIITGDLQSSQNGQRSHGILAQSIGGNGGAAGWSGSLAFSGSESYNMAVSIGGFGGDGADGNTVTVTNSGVILITGDRAHGIMAQSIGGGGGTGGDTGLDKDVWGENVIGDTAVEKAINGNADEIDAGAGGAYSGSTGANSMSLSVSVGGLGGDGGLGGEVNVTNDGTIITFGVGGHGVYAQSVGGGGGEGGVSTAAAGAVKASNAGSFAISVGGFGGVGGHGGNVNVANNGSIITTGPGSFGVFAQSVGGGGGDGGDSRAFTLQVKADIENVVPAKQFATTVGGFGGAAGEGGDVVVSNDGSIFTVGAASTGIFAQSVGGGGGVGGVSKTSNEELAVLFENEQKARFKKWNIAVGGFGGGGGDGGAVTVNNTANGAIVVQGDGANAIYAQSVGGGGGEGSAGNSGFGGDISIGGWGGNAGDGGVVTVTNDGDLATEGAVASAIYAQSIGGGGGNGGNADFGSLRTVRNQIIKDIRKTGSVRGGLKNFLKNTFKPSFGVAVGGFAGAAGDGGAINVTNAGNISTTGDLSHGVFAQSVGGGGGTGGTAHLSNVGKVGIGGAGGVSGDGGDILVTQSGDIITTGVGSYGVFAQSVGGGGGVAGDISLGVDGFGISLTKLTSSFSDDIIQQIDALGVVYDFFNPGDGAGGAVTVRSDGLVYVQGGNSSDTEERGGSIGIFAQSVGGGGGLVANTISITETEVGADLDGDGDIDDTAFDVQTGQGFAGSVGGDGKGGAVEVTHSGSILAPAYNGVGIFAQSVGGEGGENITINLTNGGDITLSDGSVIPGGVIMGGVLADDGSGIAAAIIIDGGNNNEVNLGSGTMVYALSGRAIIASDGLDADSGAAVAVGNETINNSGTVIGIVDVGQGNNAFNNKSGGEFITSTLINLGDSGNLLTNEAGGVINPYAMETAATTELSGGFVQQDGGTYIVDASFDNPSNNLGDTDLINATGKVDLQGLVVPNLLFLSDDTPQVILSSGTGDVTVGADVQDTLVVDFGLDSDQNNVYLTINSVDFSITGLTPNQTSTGDHFNDIVLNSNIGANQTLAAVMADLANLPNTDDGKEKLAFALDHLHSEPYLGQQMVSLFSDIKFISSMAKCDDVEGRKSYIVNSNCIWADVTIGKFSKDRTWANIGLKSELSNISGGYQRAIGERTVAGVSFQYGRGNISVDDRLGFEQEEYSKNFKAGAFVKYNKGNVDVTVGGSFGYDIYDENRRIIRFYETTGDAVTGRLNDPELVTLMTNGTSEVRSYGAYFRASYTHRIKSFYLRPFIEANINHIEFSKFEEDGAEGLNLLLTKTDNTLFSAMPGLEFGGEFKFDSGLTIKPFVSVGALIFNDPSLALDTRFEGSPSDVGSFKINTEFDDVIGTVKAGINLSHAEHDVNLKLKYEGKFSDDVDEHSGTVNFSVGF